MEFRDYLKLAEAAAGGREELAIALDQKPNAITDAKGHRRGLPVYACIELARLIEVDPMEVIAASELVTEKNEKRKAIFLPFVHMAGYAQPMMLAGVAATTTIALATANSFLFIRNFLL